MMPVLQDEVLKRVERRAAFEDKVAAEVRRRMAKTQAAISDLVRNRPLDAVAPGRRQQRINGIVARGQRMIADMYRDIRAITRGHLRDLTFEEARSVRAMLASVIKTQISKIRIPTPTQLRSIASGSIVKGASLSSWWGKHNSAAQLAYQAQMQMGMTQGESVAQLLFRVAGRRVNGRQVGGVISIGRRGAETLIRTSVTQVANDAALLTYAKNTKLTEAYEYWAILDDRTTDTCLSLHGNTYRYDDAFRVSPPQHWGCRSTIIPILLASVVIPS